MNPDVSSGFICSTLGAEKRIRTSGRVTPVTRFPIVLFRPLRHLSKVSAYRIIAYRGETDKQNEAKNQKSPDRIHTRRQKKARVASFANIAFTAETALAPLARQKIYPLAHSHLRYVPPHLSRRDSGFAMSKIRVKISNFRSKTAVFDLFSYKNFLISL